MKRVAKVLRRSFLFLALVSNCCLRAQMGFTLVPSVQCVTTSVNTATGSFGSFPPNSICNWSVVTSGSLVATFTQAQQPSMQVAITFTGCGSYSVVATGSVNGSPSFGGTIGGLIVCAAVPTVAVSSSAPDGILCPTQNITLTASGANSYSWSQLNATGPTVVVTPTPNTVFCYSVVGSNAPGCESSATAGCYTVPPFPAMMVVGPKVICKGQSTTLDVYGVTSFTWAGGITNNTIMVTPTTTTIYTVTGQNYNCPSVTQTVAVIISVPPVSVTPSQTTICKGSSAILTTDGTADYLWTGPTGTFNGNSISVTPSVSTVFTVVGTNAYNCTAKSTATVNVYPADNFSAYITPSVICPGETATIITSGSPTMTVNGQVTSGTMTVSPPADKSYACWGTSVYGCNVLKLLFLSTSCVDIQERKAEDEIILYPVPAENRIYLERTRGESATLEIYEASSGKLLQCHKIFDCHESIDVSSFPAGMLFIKVYDEERSRTFKVLKR
jgi:hypothetical protein